MSVLDRFRLDDRVVIVTGASSGLGVAFACAMAEAGADLVIAARRPGRLQETAELRRQPWPPGGRGDSGRNATSGLRRIVDEAMGSFGRVDVLVNNAGIEYRGASVSRRLRNSSAPSST